MDGNPSRARKRFNNRLLDHSRDVSRGVFGRHGILLEMGRCGGQSSMEGSYVGIDPAAFIGDYGVYISFVLQFDTHSGSFASLPDMRRKYDGNDCSI
mmetsp:Transcript_19542/g.41209  ORF Transcript_19542/g.41209 Transcript_19542/m.41209 type:complete len:97 (-) Transcript_19542:428-718(-)